MYMGHALHAATTTTTTARKIPLAAEVMAPVLAAGALLAYVVAGDQFLVQVACLSAYLKAGVMLLRK